MKRDTMHAFTPVKLHYKGKIRDIGCVEQAAYELLKNWPEDDGEHFLEAVKACLDCFEAGTEASTVRHLFVAAAQEAGIRTEE